jgi:hypothetical protein
MQSHPTSECMMECNLPACRAIAQFSGHPSQWPPVVICLMRRLERLTRWRSLPGKGSLQPARCGMPKRRRIYFVSFAWGGLGRKPRGERSEIAQRYPTLFQFAPGRFQIRGIEWRFYYETSIVSTKFFLQTKVSVYRPFADFEPPAGKAKLRS